MSVAAPKYNPRVLEARMNFIPLFVMVILIISALLLLITWRHEQRLSRSPSLWYALEPNSLLLMGLLLLAIVVLLVFIGLVIWF